MQNLILQQELGKGQSMQRDGTATASTSQGPTGRVSKTLLTHPCADGEAAAANFITSSNVWMPSQIEPF